MLTKSYLALLGALLVLTTVVFATSWAADKAPAAKKNCCEAKLACCETGSACCAAPKKLGCCEKGMACCDKGLACCSSPQACCGEGQECCEEGKACCGAKDEKKVSVTETSASCCAPIAS